MKVHLRFFSMYRDVVGKTSLSIQMPENSTLNELIEELITKFPRLRAYKDTIILAVNRDFADLGTKLKDGDEVALMPPVGGG